MVWPLTEKAYSCQLLERLVSPGLTVFVLSELLWLLLSFSPLLLLLLAWDDSELFPPVLLLLGMRLMINTVATAIIAMDRIAMIAIRATGFFADGAGLAGISVGASIEASIGAVAGVSAIVSFIVLAGVVIGIVVGALAGASTGASGIAVGVSVGVGAGAAVGMSVGGVFGVLFGVLFGMFGFNGSVSIYDNPYL